MILCQSLPNAYMVLSHFTDVKFECLIAKSTQDHTANKKWSWDLVPGLPDTKAQSFIVLLPLWRVINGFICLVRMALLISGNPGL